MQEFLLYPSNYYWANHLVTLSASDLLFGGCVKSITYFSKGKSIQQTNIGRKFRSVLGHTKPHALPGVLSPQLKRPERVSDHVPPSNVDVKFNSRHKIEYILSFIRLDGVNGYCTFMFLHYSYCTFMFLQLQLLRYI